MNSSPVQLRPLCPADVSHILTWVNEPAVVGNLASFDASRPFSRADETAYITEMIASDDDRVFSVFASDDDRYLGQVGLHQIFWRSRVGRLSLIIGSKDEWGKGFGRAAIAAMLDYAFGTEKLHKVWLMVFRDNARARRTYSGVGFSEEGVLREEYFHAGAWHDMVRMSLLAQEWQGRAELRS